MHMLFHNMCINSSNCWPIQRCFHGNIWSRFVAHIVTLFRRCKKLMKVLIDFLSIQSSLDILYWVKVIILLSKITLRNGNLLTIITCRVIKFNLAYWHAQHRAEHFILFSFFFSVKQGFTKEASLYLKLVVSGNSVNLRPAEIANAFHTLQQEYFTEWKNCFISW